MPGLMDSLRDKLKYLRMSKEKASGQYESSGPVMSSESGQPSANRLRFPSERAGSGSESVLEEDQKSSVDSDFEKRMEKLRKYVDSKLEPTYAGSANKWLQKRGVDLGR